MNNQRVIVLYDGRNAVVPSGRLVARLVPGEVGTLGCNHCYYSSFRGCVAPRLRAGECTDTPHAHWKLTKED